jgi:WGR domain
MLPGTRTRRHVMGLTPIEPDFDLHDGVCLHRLDAICWRFTRAPHADRLSLWNCRPATVHPTIPSALLLCPAYRTDIVWRRSLVTEWGQIGSAGKVMHRTFETEKLAETALVKRLKVKTRRGYVLGSRF